MASVGEPERYHAHVEGRANVPEAMEREAPLAEALTWARERAQTVLVRLHDEETYRSAGALPPAYEPTAPQWPRVPGDRLPEAATRWHVEVMLAPGLGRLRDAEERTRCDRRVEGLAVALGADGVDATEADAVVAEEAESLRRAGDEEVGYALVDPAYRLSVTVQATGMAAAGHEIEGRLAVPEGWWSMLRIGPLDRPVPVSRPY